MLARALALVSVAPRRRLRIIAPESPQIELGDHDVSDGILSQILQEGLQQLLLQVGHLRSHLAHLALRAVQRIQLLLNVGERLRLAC